MRTITDHKLPGLNEALEITVLDEPGQGGACHEYVIGYGPKEIAEGGSGLLEGHIREYGCGSAYIAGEDLVEQSNVEISFQNGPIQEFGVNGISGEALLAIVIDRLRCFQAGPYASNENMHALTYLQQALDWLQKRTKERLARGVEGTSAK